jgi:hypothetical protein
VQSAHGHIIIVLQQLSKALSTVAGRLDLHVSRWRNNVQTKSALGGERNSVRKPYAEEAEGDREKFVVRYRWQAERAGCARGPADVETFSLWAGI